MRQKITGTVERCVASKKQCYLTVGRDWSRWTASSNL